MVFIFYFNGYFSNKYICLLESQSNSQLKALKRSLPQKYIQIICQTEDFNQSNGLIWNPFLFLYHVHLYPDTSANSVYIVVVVIVVVGVVISNLTSPWHYNCCNSVDAMSWNLMYANKPSFTFNPVKIVDLFYLSKNKLMFFVFVISVFKIYQDIFLLKCLKTLMRFDTDVTKEITNKTNWKHNFLLKRSICNIFLQMVNMHTSFPFVKSDNVLLSQRIFILNSLFALFA